MRQLVLLSSIGLAVVALTSASADQSKSCVWSEFRNGGSSQAASVLPMYWSPTERLAWQRELPGYGQSSPVIHRGKVYLTAVEGPMKEACLVICLELQSGDPLWIHRLDAGNLSPSNYMNSRAAPTPVVDDRAVYVFFESGDILAINHHGDPLWHRNLANEYGAFENNHGLGTSPTQNEEYVFLNIQHDGPSHLIALSKRTGQTVWKADRASAKSWTSPIVIDLEGRQAVVVSSAGTVDAYDASTGETIWSFDQLSGNTVPSPVAIDGRLYIGARPPEFASDRHGARSNLCLDMMSLEDGQPAVLWRAHRAICDYASPVIAGDHVYLISRVGVVYCLDRHTGQMHYAQRLGTECWATPIVASGYVYFFGKDGNTVIVRSGPEFEVVASNRLWNADDPPAPETYVEHHGQRGTSGSHGASHGDQATEHGGPPGARQADGGPGSRLLARLMKYDADGDGMLSEDELPPEIREIMEYVDTNRDGKLDADEIRAMAESFAARRADSQSSSRDPIVYGVAAAEGAIVIRTGTRVYAVR